MSTDRATGKLVAGPRKPTWRDIPAVLRVRVAELATSMYAGKLADEAYHLPLRLDRHEDPRRPNWNCEYKGVPVPLGVLRHATHVCHAEDWAERRRAEGSRVITDVLVWLK
jgi:hypothetical protein